MSFWSDFEGALGTAVKAAEADVVAAAKYLSPMLVASGQEVAQAALGAVLAQAPSVLSGSEKLSVATASVVNTLAASSKSVAASVAMAAVQAAYNAIAPAKS